mgnify:FL=1
MRWQHMYDPIYVNTENLYVPSDISSTESQILKSTSDNYYAYKPFNKDVRVDYYF